MHVHAITTFQVTSVESNYDINLRLFSVHDLWLAFFLELRGLRLHASAWFVFELDV
jgi:hypothetical protein